jgi:glycosyltransferase involved in cell wall biosynthesis
VTLRRAIDVRGLSDRVKLIGRIDDAQLVDHLAHCRAVCFPPFDEDYGFVTVEAFSSSKPVVTCTDSGGPAELVTDGVSGFVCAPRPEMLAIALRDLMADTSLCMRMGRAGQARVAAMTWERALKQVVLV